jgi:hypothetical protein
MRFHERRHYYVYILTNRRVPHSSRTCDEWVAAHRRNYGIIPSSD